MSPQMDRQARKRIIRVCWMDIVLVGPMAIPPLALFILSIVADIDAALGFASPVSTINPLGLIFMNVVGILATVWSIVRIRETSRLNTALDSGARVLVVLVLVYGWMHSGPSVLFILFTLTELGGAAVQMIALGRDRTAAEPGRFTPEAPRQ